MRLFNLPKVAVLTAILWTMATTPAMAAFCEKSGHGASSADPQVDTALGCIPVKVDDFVVWLLPFLFGIAGGISFLLMAYGFILMTTSGGEPKAIQGAQETITSAIMGLLTSIFALFIIRLIGVGILKIPGLS